MRHRWREWGEQPASIDQARAFQRFGTLVARTLTPGRTLASRVEASWMDGVDLDRFSRYSFGAFDNRLRDTGFGGRARGYPGAGAAVEVGGPFRTLWSVEWGYGFRGRRECGRLGTQALRVTGYRTF